MKQKSLIVSRVITNFQKHKQGTWGRWVVENTEVWYLKIDSWKMYFLWPFHVIIIGIRHSCNYHIIIVKVMCGQMVAMFRRGHNTEFLTSDKKIDVVQTEHHCTWPAARRPHGLPSCCLTEGSHSEQKVDSFSQ